MSVLQSHTRQRRRVYQTRVSGSLRGSRVLIALRPIDSGVLRLSPERAQGDQCVSEKNTIRSCPDLPSLAPLDDQALLAELPRLARCERSATVALVARLAELDARERGRVTSLPMSGVRSGSATAAAARSWARTAGAATSAVGWSSITSTPTCWEARRRWGNTSLRCQAHNAHEAVAWFGSRDPARQLVPERVPPRVRRRHPATAAP